MFVKCFDQIAYWKNNYTLNNVNKLFQKKIRTSEKLHALLYVIVCVAMYVSSSTFQFSLIQFTCSFTWLFFVHYKTLLNLNLTKRSVEC